MGVDTIITENRNTLYQKEGGETITCPKCGKEVSYLLGDGEGEKQGCEDCFEPPTRQGAATGQSTDQGQLPSPPPPESSPDFPPMPEPLPVFTPPGVASTAPGNVDMVQTPPNQESPEFNNLMVQLRQRVASNNGQV